MNIEFLNADGEVINYEVLDAISPLKGNPRENVDFSAASGKSCASGDLYEKFDTLPSWSNFESDDFSEARGRRTKGTVFDKEERARRRGRREARRDARQQRKSQRTSSKAEARTARAQAKLGQAEAQKSAAQSLTDKSADIALAGALGQVGAGQAGAGQQTGLSRGAKIGLIVGGIAVLGLVGFLIYKSKTGASKKG